MSSFLEKVLEADLRRAGIGEWVNEYRFHPPRRWRFDFAWPGEMIAIEVDGGTRTYGRHNRADGYERDCEKLNTAAVDGWTVLRFTSDMVKRGEVIPVLKQLGLNRPD